MTDAPGHLDLDALADVLAGERDDAHLRTCLPCTDRLAELAAADASVTAALAALPPPPLPDGLPARLARALQDERRRELDRVRPLRRRPPAWLPAVAASAVLVMAGAVGWSLLDVTGQGSAENASPGDTAADSGGGGGGDESEAAAPEAAAGLAAPPAGTPTDWADETARPAALVRLLATGDPSASSAAPFDTALPDDAAPPADDALARLRDPAALAACLSGLPGGAGDLIAVDYAQYAGVPAVAVVQADGPATVEVTVVGSGCSAEEPAVLSTVLLPRP